MTSTVTCEEVIARLYHLIVIVYRDTVLATYTYKGIMVRSWCRYIILYSMLSPCHNVIMRLETLLGWKFYISLIKNLDTAKNNFCEFNQAGKSTKSVEKFEWWAKMELKKCEIFLGDSGTIWSMSFHIVGRKKWPCYGEWQKANSCSKSMDNYLFFGIEHAEKLLHTVSVNEDMKNSRFRLNFIL